MDLVFHMVFGRTVPDLSLNAIANLGYAGVKFSKPVFEGDTIYGESEILETRTTSRGDRGIVYTESRAFNQNGDKVLTLRRRFLVPRREGRVN